MAAIDAKKKGWGKGKGKDEQREEVWQRDSDLFCKLKEQEQNVRAACDHIGLLSCRCHLLTLMLVIVAWRLVTQRSTWVSIVFLAYGSLGVIYVR